MLPTEVRDLTWRTAVPCPSSGELALQICRALREFQDQGLVLPAVILGDQDETEAVGRLNLEPREFERDNDFPLRVRSGTSGTAAPKDPAPRGRCRQGNQLQESSSGASCFDPS